MAILKKDGGTQHQGQQQRRPEQGALTRPEHPELVRGPFQSMRDPFQMMMRDPFQLMRDMMSDPFRVLQQLSSWGDVGFGGLGREGREGRELVWNPSFEVRETDDAIVLKADVPGVRQDDLDIQLVGNNLRISGKREHEQEQEEGTLHTYERSFGQFSRSFVLPEFADLDKVTCDLKDGVLNLVVPKKAGTTPQRRKIQIGGAGSAKA
jgi:HSP20 family protein